VAGGLAGGRWEFSGGGVDGLDGDLVAEAFQTADVVAGLAADVRAAFVVVRAEVGVGGVWVREQAGQDTGRDAILVSSTARPFRPIATCQGVVASGGDAEWLLVRTAARVREMERRGYAVLDMAEDIDDKQTLSAALAAACGLSSSEVLDRLEPRISARAGEMQRAVEAAAEMGRGHGLAGVQPYCPLDADGDDSRLMAAFGETEPTTHANAWYRLALAGAYTDACRLASATSGPGTLKPTEEAGRDFPYRPGGPVPPGDAAPAAGQVGLAARAEPRRPRKRLR
jgi:hypothetical protein